MNYKNGKELLPPQLLAELQKYVQGELVYIPRKGDKRAGWGSVNGTRLQMESRNMEIRKLYDEGKTVCELVNHFHLSEDSIRKIINKCRHSGSALMVR